MIPSIANAGLAEEESRVYGTVAFDFLMSRRSGRKEELESIKKAIEDTSLDHVHHDKTPEGKIPHFRRIQASINGSCST